MGIDGGFMVETDQSKIDRLRSENAALRSAVDNRKRRERIATAFGQGMLAGDFLPGDPFRWIDEPEKFAGNAIELADALIAALDDEGA